MQWGEAVPCPYALYSVGWYVWPITVQLAQIQFNFWFFMWLHIFFIENFVENLNFLPVLSNPSFAVPSTGSTTRR